PRLVDDAALAEGDRPPGGRLHELLGIEIVVALAFIDSGDAASADQRLTRFLPVEHLGVAGNMNTGCRIREAADRVVAGEMLVDVWVNGAIAPMARVAANATKTKLVLGPIHHDGMGEE